MNGKFPCVSSKAVSLYNMTVCVLGINYCSKPELYLLFVHVVVVVDVFAFLFVIAVFFNFSPQITGQDQ